MDGGKKTNKNSGFGGEKKPKKKSYFWRKKTKKKKKIRFLGENGITKFLFFEEKKTFKNS